MQERIDLPGMPRQVDIAKSGPHRVPHQANPARAADQDDIIDFRQRDSARAGPGQGFVAALDGAIHLVLDEPMESLPINVGIHTPPTAGLFLQQVRHMAAHWVLIRQIFFEGLGGPHQALEIGGAARRSQVEKGRSRQAGLFAHISCQQPIKIVAAQKRIAADAEDLVIAQALANDRHVKGAAAEIVDQVHRVAVAVGPGIIHGGGRRLVQ